VRSVQTHGRASVIDAILEDWPGAEGTGKAMVLCGVGGVGKTTVALEVCRAARASGRDAWWVSAVDRASFEGGMRAVGYAAGATPGAFDQASHADVVWRVLTAHERPWLLVVDDANDVSVLTGAGSVADESGWVRRPPAHGLMLVTSRDGSRSTWRWLAPRKVESLAPSDGAAVLLDLAPGAGDAAAASALSARLGGMPQLLHLAGSTLAENGRIPETWVDRADSLRTFDDYARALQAHTGGHRGTKTLEVLLHRVWDISFGQIDKLKLPHARRVLMLLCCFEDGPLPYERVLDPGLLATSGLVPGVTPAALLGAIEGLDGLGMLTITDAVQSSGEPAHARKTERILTIPDVLIAAARAHPYLHGPEGDVFRRAAIQLLIRSIGQRATGPRPDAVDPSTGHQTWLGPVPRAMSTNSVGDEDLATLVTLERMIERQTNVCDDALELQVVVGEDDDGDLVVERHTTLTHQGFVCRSVQPITADQETQVWDLELSSEDKEPIQFFAFIGTRGKVRVVLFLPHRDEPHVWTMRYRPRGLFAPWRKGHPDHFYYDTRGPRGGASPLITDLSVRFELPVPEVGIREVGQRGSFAVERSGTGVAWTWRPHGQPGDRYLWHLTHTAATGPTPAARNQLPPPPPR
jgi:hypothetical protein